VQGKAAGIPFKVAGNLRRLRQYFYLSFLNKINSSTLLPVGFAVDRLEGDSIKTERACTPFGEAVAVFRHGCSKKNN